MRLQPIPPAELSAAQRALYDDMQAGIARSAGLQGFRTSREDGALIGPFNPWLHTPAAGHAMWEMTKALSADSVLPEPCRQVAILVTGAHFRAEYEVYAHEAVAAAAGLSPAQIATITARQRPSDLGDNEAAAYDIAAALVAGGPLAASLSQRGEAAFGAKGMAELIYLVGLYALVSMTLNGFAEPVPA